MNKVFSLKSLPVMVIATVLSACGGGSDESGLGVSNITPAPAPVIVLSIEVDSELTMGEGELKTLPINISYNGNANVNVSIAELITTTDYVTINRTGSTTSDTGLYIIASQVVDGNSTQSTYEITVSAGGLNKKAEIVVNVNNTSLLDAISRTEFLLDAIIVQGANFSLDETVKVLSRYLEQAKFLQVLSYNQFDEAISLLNLIKPEIEGFTREKLTSIQPYFIPNNDEDASLLLATLDQYIPSQIEFAMTSLANAMGIFDESLRLIEDLGLPPLDLRSYAITEGGVISYFMGNTSYGTMDEAVFTYSDKYKLLEVILEPNSPCKATQESL
jgi:hypothetical protein